ncbi:uncharacterized protein [Primulina eburnea]|uniref:uncharacterized protein n=1 Tax=Primulina eburnea TaxID=1245227 RepID=UPI003C6C0375
MPPKKDKDKRPIQTSVDPVKPKSWYEIVTKEEELDTAQSKLQIPKKENCDIETRLQILEALLEASKDKKSLEKENSEEKSSKIQVSNTFQVLSNSDDSPTTSSQKQSLNPQVSLTQPYLKASSEFFEKPIWQNIINTERGFDSSEPFQILQKYFGKGRYYKPYDINKTPYFYQAILEITESVIFKNFFLEEKHEDPAYSTCKILKVIAPADWGYDLTKSLFFPEKLKETHFFEIPFNYWDYHQAWYNSFLIQNQKHKHTWLFYFDTKICDPKQFPFWWNSWWEFFGSSYEILKPPIQSSFNLFKAQYKPTDEEKSLQPLALFCTKFYVPWVLAWTVELSDQKLPVLIRKFKVKWWDKFKSPPSLSIMNIQKWIKDCNVKTPETFQTPQQTDFLVQKSQMAAMLATAKTPEEMQAILMKFTPALSNRSESPEPSVHLDDDDDGPIFGNSGM